MDTSGGNPAWAEGEVNTDEDHFKLSYFDDPSTKGDSTWPPPVALVGRGEDQSVTVQFLLDGLPSDRAQTIKETIESDLQILVVDHWIPDQASPWPYLEYWAGSFGNAYSSVDWSLFPRDREGWLREHQGQTQAPAATKKPLFFRRRLDAGSFRSLLEKPLRAVVDAVKEQDSALDLQLRGSYVDVYYEGLSVFHIRFDANTIRVASHDKTVKDGKVEVMKNVPPGWSDNTRRIDEFDPNEVPALISWVKELRQDKLKLEKQFEAKVIRDNGSAESPVIVLDRQIAIPGERGQMDVLFYDRAAERLTIAELKVADNSEIQGHAFQQLRNYGDVFNSRPEIAATYPHIFEQKVALGLVNTDVRAMRVDQPPILLLLFAGYALAKNGHKRDTEYLHRALMSKTTEFASMDVRVQAWQDFASENCRLTTAPSELPDFESWASENLTFSPSKDS